MMLLLGILLAVWLGATPVAGGSLQDIEHVVIFMKENRAWDTVHLSSIISNGFVCGQDDTDVYKYFGTMAGVRGFNDPNVQVNQDGQSVWYQ